MAVLRPVTLCRGKLFRQRHGVAARNTCVLQKRETGENFVSPTSVGLQVRLRV